MDKIKEMTNQAENDVNQCEYIQYAQDVEKTLSHLESQLHNSDDPEEIIMNTLVAAAEFYDGDWAGIMDADLTMKIWSTLFWYNRRTNRMSPNRFGDIEEGENLWRWIDALTHGNPMIIRDVEEIRQISPIEYEFMKSNGVRTMVAVPFWKRPIVLFEKQIEVLGNKAWLNESAHGIHIDVVQIILAVAVSAYLFLSFIEGHNVGENTLGDVLDLMLRNTGIVNQFLFAAQAARYLRFDIQFLRCGWVDAVCGWQISFPEETENAAAVKP